MQISPLVYNPTPTVARASLSVLPSNLPTWGSADQVTISHKHPHHGHGPSGHDGNSNSSSSGPAPAPPAPKPSGVYYDPASDAKARDAYYGDLPSHFQGEDGKQVYDELHSLVSRTHHGLPYAPDTYLYPEVDRHPDNQIYSIYSGEGPMNLNDHNSGNVATVYNCEHVVPQSWFGKKNPMRGDLHHLFACENKCNSIRGNAPYTDLPDSGPGEESIIACGISTDDRHHFEPKAGRGEVARAVLYFLLCYPGEIGDTSGEYGAKDLPLLLQWNKENPVTDYERHRNATIQGLQGNRNPLVDFPELADKIDFTSGLGKVGREQTSSLTAQGHNSSSSYAA